MSYEKNFEFTAAVRGYHYYRRFWAPKPLQQLYCFFEDDNPFDQFAMKVCEEEGQKTPIGHLPREFSRAMKFLIDRGANITVTLRNDHYRRSPLVQGGMKISWKVRASIPGTCINLLIMERYKKLIEETYTKPKNEKILGSCLNQQEVEEDPEPRQRTKKIVLKRKEVATKDIRNSFAPVSTVSSSKRNNTNKAIIEID